MIVSWASESDDTNNSLIGYQPHLCLLLHPRDTYLDVVSLVVVVLPLVSYWFHIDIDLM
jgi:hypothetical protein